MPTTPITPLPFVATLFLAMTFFAGLFGVATFFAVLAAVFLLAAGLRLTCVAMGWTPAVDA